MIDKITHENAVDDIRNGMSYYQAAKLHGVDDFTVEKWCRAVNVRSLHASRRKTDKELLDVIVLHKVVTSRALGEIFGYTKSALDMRLRSMVMGGKIQSFRIPPLSSAARFRHGFFTKFINTRIYYVSKDDLAMWVRNQLPAGEVPVSLRKCVTRMFRSAGIQIFKAKV